MAYFEIIGAGAPELSERRYASGLVVYSNKFYLGIDISPRNSFRIVRRLHDKNFAFAATHGHPDHFDPEIPWREIFDPKFVQFSPSTPIRRVYLNKDAANFLLKYNGLYEDQLLSKPTFSYTRNGVIIKRKNNKIFIGPRNTPKTGLEIILIENNRPYTWGSIQFIPFEASHPWNMPPHPPFIIKNGKTVGFYFISPFKGIYLPDFDLKSITKNQITSLMAKFPPKYIVIGMSDPIQRELASAHSSLKKVLTFFDPLQKIYGFTMIFTHRNPLWERLKKPRLPKYVRLADPFMRVKV